MQRNYSLTIAFLRPFQAYGNAFGLLSYATRATFSPQTALLNDLITKISKKHSRT